MASDSGSYTPETIARRAKIAEALLKAANDPQEIGHWTQGLAQMGKAASGRYQLNELEKIEREGSEQLNREYLKARGVDVPDVAPTAEAPSLRGRIASALGFGGEATPASTPTRAPAASGGGLPAMPQGQDGLPPVAQQGPDYGRAIASVESAGEKDPYRAIGNVTSDKGNRAYGKHQVMDFNIGPWTKEVLGQEMTPQQYLDNPQAQDAVFKAKFGQYMKQTGDPQDAASMWFTGKPMSKAVTKPDVNGMTRNGYVDKFMGDLNSQVWPPPPSAGGEAVASSPAMRPQPGTAGMAMPPDPAAVWPVPPSAGGETVASALAAQSPPPAMPPGMPTGAMTPPTSRPNMGAMAPVRPPMTDNPTLAAAERMMANRNPIVAARGRELMQEYMKKQLGAEDTNEQKDFKYEQQLRAARGLPPMRSMTEFKKREPIKIDTATGTVLLDPDTHEPIKSSAVPSGAAPGTIPKDIKGREAAEKAGAVQGPAQVALPEVLAKGEQALKTIDQIRTHPGRSLGTGALGTLPGIPGTQQRDFVALIDQAKGQTFVQAFEALKGAGQITEKEGEKGAAALGRLDRAQTEKGFDDALNDLRDVIKGGMGRAPARAGLTAAPAPAAGGFKILKVE